MAKDAGSPADGRPGATFVDPGDAGLLGVARCRGSGLPLCTDFESTGIEAPWKVEEYPRPKAGSRVTIDDTRAARGARALRLSFEAGIADNQIRMLGTRTLPPGGHLWGRAFLYFSARPKPHGVLFRASGVNELGNPASYSVDVFTGRFTGDYIQPKPFVEKPAECNPAYAAGRCNTDDPLVPAERWVCLEWEMDAEHGQATRLWRDGVPIKLIVYAGTWPKIAAFTSLQVGFQVYSETPAMDVWMDEVAVDTQRIGCDR